MDNIISERIAELNELGFDFDIETARYIKDDIIIVPGLLVSISERQWENVITQVKQQIKKQ